MSCFFHPKKTQRHDVIFPPILYTFFFPTSLKHLKAEDMDPEITFSGRSSCCERFSTAMREAKALTNKACWWVSLRVEGLLVGCQPGVNVWSTRWRISILVFVGWEWGRWLWGMNNSIQYIKPKDPWSNFLTTGLGKLAFTGIIQFWILKCWNFHWSFFFIWIFDFLRETCPFHETSTSHKKCHSINTGIYIYRSIHTYVYICCITCIGCAVARLILVGYL